MTIRKTSLGWKCDRRALRYLFCSWGEDKFSEWRVQKVGFQRSDLTDHQKAADKNPALRGNAMLTPQEMWTAAKEKATQQAQTKLEDRKASVLPLVDLTMVLGSEEVSMRKSEAFLAWGERNGVACTSSWRSKNYNWSFATATADVQRQVLKERVRGLKYGVIMDESTDCALAKQLVLYVKVQGAVLFAGMLDMAADGSGEGIKNACVQLLTDLDMERKNPSAVATYGAAAMRGSKKGATKLLSDWAEGPVFTSHCVLHRINLAVVDVFDGKPNCPDVVQELAVEIETSLRYAYSYFNRSTANRKELQTVGALTVAALSRTPFAKHDGSPAISR